MSWSTSIVHPAGEASLSLVFWDPYTRHNFLQSTMATSVAPAINGSALAFESPNARGHGHSRSAHRKAAPERLRGGYALPRTDPNDSLLTPQLNGTPSHLHSKSVPLASWNSDAHANYSSYSKNHLESQLRAPAGVASDKMNGGLVGHATSHVDKPSTIFEVEATQQCVILYPSMLGKTDLSVEAGSLHPKPSRRFLSHYLSF